jgi:hypothetical protein
LLSIHWFQLTSFSFPVCMYVQFQTPTITNHIYLMNNECKRDNSISYSWSWCNLCWDSLTFVCQEKLELRKWEKELSPMNGSSCLISNKQCLERWMDSLPWKFLNWKSTPFNFYHS